MKEQYRYGIILSVLLITITFMISDYNLSVSKENDNFSRVVSNINIMDNMTDEFIAEAVSLGEFTVLDSKLTIVEGEINLKSNATSFSISNGEYFYKSNSRNEVQLSHEDKSQSLDL